jgi:hypothetical protein
MALRADFVLSRFSDGKISVHESGTGDSWVSTFGNRNCLPAVADYNGDGRADLAWFRPWSRRVLIVFSDADNNNRANNPRKSSKSIGTRVPFR